MTIPGYQPSSDDLALVLAGGGARAAYQAGVLSAITELRPGLRIPLMTGVSAGAINTAYLAGHRGSLGQALSGLREEWANLTPQDVYRVRSTSLPRSFLRWLVARPFRQADRAGVVQGLMDLLPLRGFLEGCVELDGIEQNIISGRLRAVALSATSYTTGKTVTFMQAVPEIPVWERAERICVRATLTIDHVMASAAIPIIFPAVRMKDGFYGDGSVRQFAPLAPAIHMGATRILAIAMRSHQKSDAPARPPASEYPTTAQVAGVLLNAIFTDALDTDAERLEGINRLLRERGADFSKPRARPIRLLLLRPTRDLGELSEGLAHKLPTMVRWLVNSLGGKRAGSSDFVSYLLFEPTYTNRLLQLGYEDAMGERDRITEFLDAF